MRLLDLVEEEHGVRPPPDRFAQLAGLFVADVARRCSDESRNGVALLELAHVEPHHQTLVAEERLGECPGKLGLADAGRAEEEEAPVGPVRIGQSRARAPHGLSHCGDRLVLSDDPAVELLLQPH